MNIDSIINSSKKENDLHEIRKDNELQVNSIYRFKFTDLFMKDLYNFSKIHQYDERNDFKEAWKIWLEENDEAVDKELERLLRLGYHGDVLNKMFKSARYYFRKKTTDKKEPKERRQYSSLNKELLNEMDKHIEENKCKENYAPKNGFIDFCLKNELILKEGISRMFEQGIKDKELIQNKIKKTYKNRYFMITNK
uniref:Uncharacterized protein n=1 Tax=viral metagenome TaxID=1070528 RepID=A0A6C0KNT2_9ZZZZ